MGTIGGSIANNDPAADYPSAMLALDATIITNQRSVPASAFFTGLFETVLEPDEIVTAVEFTAPDKAAYKKFPNPASLYAMAGVFVARSGDHVRVAVTGAGENGVFRLEDAETALAGSFSPSVSGYALGQSGRSVVRFARIGGISCQPCQGDGEACGGGDRQPTDVKSVGGDLQSRI